MTKHDIFLPPSLALVIIDSRKSKEMDMKLDESRPPSLSVQRQFIAFPVMASLKALL